MPEDWHPPSFLDKVNGIIDFFEDPCHAPWMVYLELAKVPAGHAVLQLIEPSLTDVLRGYFRPKGLRLGGHMRRKGKKGRPHRRGIPDTSELIAHRMPGYSPLSMRKIGDLERYLWLVDGFGQRLLWYWLVADVTVTFFYEWTSAIQKSEYCSRPNAGYASVTGGPGGIVSGNWQNYGSIIATAEEGTCSVGPLGMLISPGGSSLPGIHYLSGGAFDWTGSYAAVYDHGDGRCSWFSAVSGVHSRIEGVGCEYEYGWVPGSAASKANSTGKQDLGGPARDGVTPKTGTTY